MISCKSSRSEVKRQGHRDILDQMWVFQDRNSSFNSQLATKCYTTLEVSQKRRPIVFQGHSLKIKDIRDEKSPIWLDIERFRAITPVWIHSWLLNKWHTRLGVAQKRCPMVFQGHPANFKVTRAEKSIVWLRFECFRKLAPLRIRVAMKWHIIFRSMEEVAYYFKVILQV